MSDGERQLAPITRELLREHYKQYPMERPPARLDEVRVSVRAAYEGVAGLPWDAETDAIGDGDGPGDGDGDELRAWRAELRRAAQAAKVGDPRRIDEAMWRSRQQCEEIVAMASTGAHLPSGALPALLGAADGGEEDRAKWAGQCRRVAEAAEAIAARVREYQKGGMDRAERLARSWVPQDFRANVVKFKRDRMEARYGAEIDALMKGGGSIRDKYDLHWRHQMQRRQSLVDVGNATGAFRFVIKMIGGVPEEFLKFIRTMNDDNGPMEELRQTYGFILFFYYRQLNVALMLLLLDYHALRSGPQSVRDALRPCLADHLELISESLDIVLLAFGAALDLMLVIFETSPFFVTKAEFDRLMAKQGMQTVVVKKDFDFSIRVAAGDVVRWYFKLESMDIGFSVDFVAEADADASATAIAPQTLVKYARHTKDSAGELGVQAAGTLVLKWDNSYSWLSTKKLTWSVSHQPAAVLEADASRIADAISDDDDKEAIASAMDEQ